jgi:hypothetical protein
LLLCAVAWAGGRRGGLAALVVGTLPILVAQSGWILVDLPLCALLALAWGASLRGRWGLWALAAVTALGAKVSAGAFLAGPLLALLFRRDRPALAVLGVAAYLALAVAAPPRVREPTTWAWGLLALGLHLRPALWLGAASTRPTRLDRLVLGALATVPLLLLWAPAEHLARYGMPVGVACALGVAARRPRVAAFAVGSGLVLALGGYRPAVVHHQGENLREAARALVAAGAERIEVWVDHPGSTWPPALVAAVVEYEAARPVSVGGAIHLHPPDTKRHWWEFVAPRPWQSGPADHALLGLYDAEPDAFEAAHPEWTRIGLLSPYSASSTLLPRVVGIYAESGSSRIVTPDMIAP